MPRRAVRRRGAPRFGFLPATPAVLPPRALPDAGPALGGGPSRGKAARRGAPGAAGARRAVGVDRMPGGRRTVLGGLASLAATACLPETRSSQAAPVGQEEAPPEPPRGRGADGDGGARNRRRRRRRRPEPPPEPRLTRLGAEGSVQPFCRPTGRACCSTTSRRRARAAPGRSTRRPARRSWSAPTGATTSPGDAGGRPRARRGGTRTCCTSPRAGSGRCRRPTAPSSRPDGTVVAYSRAAPAGPGRSPGRPRPFCPDHDRRLRRGRPGGPAHAAAGQRLGRGLGPGAGRDAQRAPAALRAARRARRPLSAGPTTCATAPWPSWPARSADRRGAGLAGRDVGGPRGDVERRPERQRPVGDAHGRLASAGGSPCWAATAGRRTTACWSCPCAAARTTVTRCGRCSPTAGTAHRLIDPQKLRLRIANHDWDMLAGRAAAGLRLGRRPQPVAPLPAGRDGVPGERDGAGGAGPVPRRGRPGSPTGCPSPTRPGPPAGTSPSGTASPPGATGGATRPTPRGRGSTSGSTSPPPAAPPWSPSPPDR